MSKIIVLALLVTAVFAADGIKDKSNKEKKVIKEVVKADPKEIKKKEVRSKPKTYPRGNIATH